MKKTPVVYCIGKPCLLMIVLIWSIGNGFATTGFNLEEADAIRSNIEQQEVIKENYGVLQDDALANYEASLTFLAPDDKNTMASGGVEKNIILRRWPFKKTLTEKIKVSGLVDYIQMGHQIYRYRSTFPPVLRHDQDLENLFNETSPLLHNLGIQTKTKRQRQKPYGTYGKSYQPSCFTLSSPIAVNTMEESVTGNWLWGPETGRHFENLTRLEGVSARNILDISQLINNHLHFLPGDYLPGSNTFLGMNTFFDKLFSLLDRTGARPVSISSMTAEQKFALVPIFIQGSTACNMGSPKKLVSKFEMKSQGKKKEGIYSLLENRQQSDSNEAGNYNAYFLIDAESGNVSQYLWAGFYEDKLYFGLYPTEGLLLAYQIPDEQKKRFMAELFGLLLLSPASNPDPTQSTKPVLMETFTNRSLEQHDGNAPQKVEFNYHPNGGFSLTISNDETVNTEEYAKKSSLSNQSRSRKKSFCTKVCTLDFFPFNRMKAGHMAKKPDISFE